MSPRALVQGRRAPASFVPLVPFLPFVSFLSFMVAVTLVITALVVLLGPSPVAAADRRADPPVAYRPPVDAPVIDPFRAPTHRFGPGNRGLDYGVAPLTPVRAAADGEVVFAGPVAGTLHVTVRHADGLRTSYSFLASVAVRRGQQVHQGDTIGASTDVLHFGVRDPVGTYLDPALLFEAPRHARLVPGGDDGTREPDPPAEVKAFGQVVAERAGPLSRLWGAGQTVVGPVTDDLMARARFWMYLAAESTPVPHTARILAGLDDWRRQRSSCTAADTPVAPPTGRRLLVLVGGIGSTSAEAAVDRVDAAALGYGPGEVVRFSYTGGTTAEHPYDARDSQQDLDRSAGRLALLLRATAAAHPGVPIDVVAHSQGGVVTRLAIQDSAAAGVLPAEVDHVVALASPFHGADLAAVATAGRSAPGGTAVEALAADAVGLELDPRLPAATQLTPGSTVLTRMQGGGWPADVPLTTVGARGDVVVPAPRSEAGFGHHTVVPLAGLDAHDRLPGSPEATREIGLALAGLAPTCRSLTDVGADLVISEQIARLQASTALAVAGSTGGPFPGRWPDPAPSP